MTDIHIPPAALEAGRRELYPHLLTENDDMAREIARAAFVAMVEAWPGMNAKAATDHVMLLNSTPALILPLTENLDAEA